MSRVLGQILALLLKQSTTFCGRFAADGLFRVRPANGDPGRGAGTGLLVADVLRRPAGGWKREHDETERDDYQSHEFETKGVRGKGVHDSLPHRSLELSGAD